MSDINVISRTQRIIVDQASSSVAVINTGPVGPAGPTGEVSIAYLNTELEAKENRYTGTGSPQGVFTAPIGSEYIDISATAGQVLKWIKTTTTGNTGWVALFTIPS